MNLPSQIKIGATRFNVVIEDDLRNFDDSRLDGHIKYGECKICIDSKMDGDRPRDVLMHEILHGIADHAAVNLDEGQVERLANGIAAVLVDNPAFLEIWK